MDLREAIRARHSVRSYDARKIEGEVKSELEKIIEECNRESGLHMQLVLDEPKAFDGFMAHYGKFSGVKNYIAMIGRKNADLEEKCGYYGEKVVLKAQQLGLNTCWVAMTYSKIKTAFQIDNGEKLCVVIAVGYGKTQGVEHKSKPAAKVTKVNGETPEWFRNGVNDALLAPTAMNQQNFTIALDGDKVSVKAGMGFYTKLDLGIVKCHFEIGAGRDNFRWA